MIHIYDYRQKKFTDSLNVRLRKKQYLFNYELLDKDRTLLSINSAYLGDKHDSAICIVDRNRKVLQTYSFAGTKAPVSDPENPYAYRKKRWSYAIHTNFPVRLNIYDDSVISTLAPFEVVTCDSVKANQLPFAFKLSAGHYAAARQLSATIPECSTYSDASAEIVTAPYGDYDTHGAPIFAFEHSGRLLTGRGVIEPKLKLYEVIGDKSILKYKRLVHDPFRNCFWWVIELLPRQRSPELLKNQNNYYVVRLSDQLAIASEGYLPKGYTQYIIPLEDGLMIKNQITSDSLGLGSYAILLPEQKSFDLEDLKKDLELRNTIEAQNLNELVRYLKTGTDENRFLLLSIDRMPPRYAAILMDKFLENKNNFPRQAVHIFTNDASKIPEGIKGIASVHKYDVLKKYMSDFIWPTILTETSVQHVGTETYASNQAQLLFEKLEKWIIK